EGGMMLITYEPDSTFWPRYYQRFDEVIISMRRRAEHLDRLERESAHRREKRRRAAETRARTILRRCFKRLGKRRFSALHPVDADPSALAVRAVKLAGYLRVALGTFDQKRLREVESRLVDSQPAEVS
ncbi:MAG: hypothetical protein KC800_30415, partial [Candidatus Eremiobacteraeota bacterium]|nr:hypothetical protein [Candidatus Eremiobacteraeota bacterium]